MLHLRRLGAVFTIGLVAFVAVLGASTAVSVELIGLVHEDNARVWADRPVVYQDSEICLECHEAMYEGWARQAHQGVTCENCHGSARDHIIQARRNEPSFLPLADAKDLCLVCHRAVIGRPEGFPVVTPGEHPEQLQQVFGTCTSCHTPHDPAYPTEIPHTLEGRELCLVCHAPDAWKPYSPSHIGREVDTCLDCHELGPLKETE